MSWKKALESVAQPATGGARRPRRRDPRRLRPQHPLAIPVATPAGGARRPRRLQLAPAIPLATATGGARRPRRRDPRRLRPQHPLAIPLATAAGGPRRRDPRRLRRPLRLQRVQTTSLGATGIVLRRSPLKTPAWMQPGEEPDALDPPREEPEAAEAPWLYLLVDGCGNTRCRRNYLLFHSISGL